MSDKPTKILNNRKIKYVVLVKQRLKELIEAESLRPRSKKGQAVNAIPVNLRLDYESYKRLSTQPLSMNLAVNALIQFAIEELDATGKKLKIVNDKPVKAEENQHI
jgi:hypothetical protein